MHRVFLGLMGVLGVLATLVRAQSWTIDPSFTATFEGYGDPLPAMSAGPSGTVYIMTDYALDGVFIDGTPRRVNSDGSIDPTFQPPTDASYLVMGNYPGGKVLLARPGPVWNSTYSQLLRAQSNGSIDSSFATVSMNENYAALVLSDGRILVHGTIASVNGVARVGIALINADGSLATNFHPVFSSNATVSGAFQQADGKLVVSGFFSSVNGTPITLPLVRLNLDGSLDPTFSPALAATQSVGPIYPGPNGTMLVQPKPGSSPVRLTSTGALDSTYTAKPIGTVYAWGSLQPDGKLLYFTLNNALNTLSYEIHRLNVDGSPDTAFSVPAIEGSEFSAALPVVCDDGTMYVDNPLTAARQANHVSISRLFADGTIDSNFSARVGTATVADSILEQPDGKLVIAGLFSFVDNTPEPFRQVLFRLNANGTIDSTFVGGIANGESVGRLYEQPSGRILATGSFNGSGGVTRSLVRLNVDGTRDTSFTLDTSVAAVDTAGAIYSVSAQTQLVRYTADGIVDSTFQYSPTYSITSVVALADGSVILNQDAPSSYVGMSNARYCRVLHDGTIDSTFNVSLAQLTGGTGQLLGQIALPGGGMLVLTAPLALIDAPVSEPYLKAWRVNANGTIDSLYAAPPTGWSSFWDYFSVASVMYDLLVGSNAPNGTILQGAFGASWVSVDTSGRMYQQPTTVALFQPLHAYLPNTGSVITSVPTVASGPANKTIPDGGFLSLMVAAAGGGSFTYQWNFNGAPITGATSPAYFLRNVTFANAGQYSVTVTNQYGSVTSSAATVTVSPVAPQITKQPSSATVKAGDPVAFSITATGSLPLAYQWNLNGTAIAGANASTYSVAAATAASAGTYTCTVTNAGGTVTSSAATLGVSAVAVAPSFTTQPLDSTVSDGAAVAFSVTAAGTAPLTYQWYFNGTTPISGATSATLALSAVSASNAGSYTCLVTNVAGSTISNAAVLTVKSPTVPPSIVTSPASAVITAGSTATFSVVANGTAPLTYQWTFNGSPIAGANTANYTIVHATTADAGQYAVTVANAYGTILSAVATLTVNAPAPSIVTQPSDVAVTIGSSATFTVLAAGGATYQWQYNGTPISGATSSTYTVTTTTANSGGGYSVVVANSTGSVTSRSAILTIQAASAGAPNIVSQPTTQTIAAGSTIVFNCGATVPSSALAAPRGPQSMLATGATYQWSFNGTNLTDGTTGATTIAGSSSPTLVIQGSTAANVGVYTCLVTTASGAAMSQPAMLALSSPSTSPGRLVNLSCRANVGTDADVLIAGFVVGGSSAASLPVLLRASGPALAAAPFSVPGTLADPKLDIHQTVSGQDSVLGSNVGWAGSPTIANLAKAVSAFSWGTSATPDSAISIALPHGGYTGIVSGAVSDTGVALAEVYDATANGTYDPLNSARLVNLSARGHVGAGADVMIAGFVIGGSTSVTVLLRASGPALSGAPFNVPGTLVDPKIELHQTVNSADTVLASNAGWAGNAEIALAAKSAGAFTWNSPTSKDSALLVTLPPGSYTAIVSGAVGGSNDTGIALVELYEIP